MKFAWVSVIVASLYFLNSCTRESECEDIAVNNNNDLAMEYDSVYAQSLGADEYGMRAYVIAFLKYGPVRNQSEEEVDRIQRAHLDNIKRMAENGDLLVAGPFLDEGDLRGIYIFNVQSVEKAKELTESDPAIKAGRLIMELHPWYGPASLKEILSMQRRVSKKQI